MKKYFFVAISIALLSCSAFSSKEAKKQKDLFSKIEIGMKKDDVISILGQPDNIDIDSTDNKTEYFYYSPKSEFEIHSEIPTVVFDSTGIVKFSTYGDGD